MGKRVFLDQKQRHTYVPAESNGFGVPIRIVQVLCLCRRCYYTSENWTYYYCMNIVKKVGK